MSVSGVVRCDGCQLVSLMNRGVNVTGVVEKAANYLLCNEDEVKAVLKEYAMDYNEETKEVVLVSGGGVCNVKRAPFKAKYCEFKVSYALIQHKLEYGLCVCVIAQLLLA